MKEITELVYKFNSDSKVEFHKITESKPYKLLAMLCNGKASDISDDDKIWLIKKMKQETYCQTGYNINVLGWRLYFKPYLTRFAYRLIGDKTFTIIWGIDIKSVEAYLKEYIEEPYELAELIELPENY